MKSTRLPGLHTWSEFQPDRRIDFNGFLWVRPGGSLLVDPLPASDAVARRATELGGARFVLVTNADHWRATDAWREHTGATVLAPTVERERLGGRAARVDRWFDHRGELPAELRDDVDVRWIAGGKSARECVLYLEPLRALLFGDVVRSHESGRLRLLPDDKLADPARVRQDVLALRDVHLEAVLLGDGDSLFTGARGVWLEFLRELGTAVQGR
ncbi:MAG: MBL fold metallo-hydrolase [Planctomycetes bacterium]|nr:MBL fold metallo-hydrolase [Planctomycetota bacterium]